ncbi:hypothetical protein ZWY2020_036316 [Hordeum vulgare]|nr:hypothetical protein ZWY2020_036316 [Hordeum vulgare]
MKYVLLQRYTSALYTSHQSRRSPPSRPINIERPPKSPFQSSNPFNPRNTPHSAHCNGAPRDAGPHPSVNPPAPTPRERRDGRARHHVPGACAGERRGEERKETLASSPPLRNPRRQGNPREPAAASAPARAAAPNPAGARRPAPLAAPFPEGAMGGSSSSSD